MAGRNARVLVPYRDLRIEACAKGDTGFASYCIDESKGEVRVMKYDYDCDYCIDVWAQAPMEAGVGAMYWILRRRTVYGSRYRTGSAGSRDRRAQALPSETPQLLISKH